MSNYVALVATFPGDRSAPSPAGPKHLQMVSASWSTSERQALLYLLSQPDSAFDFMQLDDAQRFPRCRARHSIDTGSAQPIRQKPYRVSPSERKVISEQVQDILKRGIIQVSETLCRARDYGEEEGLNKEVSHRLPSP